MPELPEVAALASVLESRLTGTVIERLDIIGIATLKTVVPSPRELIGATITTVGRRGKFLVITTSAGHLVVHLARAGWIRWRDAIASTPPGRRTALAVRLVVQGGAGIDITEQGHEKRLSAYVVATPDDVPGIARLGIDALDPGLSGAVLAAILNAAGNAHLKTVLADQSAIAGIGNAYSDEILHTARLSPFKPAARLEPEAIGALHESIGGVLSAAIAAADGHEPAQLKDAKRSGLRVHGRTGDPCPVCGDTIRHVDAGRKVFQYCPGCQTGGKVYADRRMSKLLR